MRRVPQRTRRIRLGAGLLVLLYLLSACSLMPTSSDEDSGPTELSLLRVGVTKSIDTIPLRLAVKNGHFTPTRLRVELVEQANSELALEALATGKIEVAFTGNLTLLAAAKKDPSLQLQGEAYIAGPETMALVTGRASGYTNPAAKASPLIGIGRDDDLAKLATKSTLRIQGIDPAKVRFQEFDSTALTDALDRVDAVWLTEPRISQAQKDLGAVVLADTGRGLMEDFPISSYVARNELATANPRTFARFREMLAEAQVLGSDSSKIRESLREQLGIDDRAAALVSVGTYPTTVNRLRLQRVADLMLSSGMLTDRLDVTTLMPPSLPRG